MEYQYKVFDWLRFPLILGVIFIHSFGTPFDYDAIDFHHLTAIDCYNLFRVSISCVMTHVCVPVFFFISGNLFFKGLESWNNRIFIQKIQRRIKSLLLPFLIWNTIFIIWVLKDALYHKDLNAIMAFFYNNGYLHLYWDCLHWNLNRTNWLGIGIPASAPYLIPLWFLRDLMIVIICSPLLYYLFRKAKTLVIILLLVCFTSGVFIRFPGFSSSAFLFFGCGGYLRVYGNDPIQCAYKYRTQAFVIALLSWIVCTLLNGHATKMGDLIYPIYVLSGSITVINVAGYMVKNNKMEFLSLPLFSKGAFFAYLFHNIFMVEFYSKVFVQLFGENKLPLMVVSYLMVPVFTIFTCLLFYFVLLKTSPSICRVLVGQR